MSTINRFGVVFVLLTLFTIGVHSSSEKVVITQEDEAAIKELADAYNKDIHEIMMPSPPLRTPYSKFRELESFKKLIQFDKKLIPYIIRQLSIVDERRIFIGAALADREIKKLEDLNQYHQLHRPRKLFEIAAERICIKQGIFVLAETSAGKEMFERWYTGYHSQVYPWLQWWDDNKNKFEFHGVEPISINTRYKDFNRPHITTEVRDGLLFMEAWGGNYPMLMERAAAEMKAEFFIGKYYDVGSSLRIHAVTVDELQYLTNRFFCIINRLYTKEGGVPFSFKGETSPRPFTNHRVPYSWGIMAKKTVLTEGESIAATIVTRGTSEIVATTDPAFFTYGSFRVTNNSGETVLDYLPITKASPTLPLLKRDKEFFPIDVTLERAKELKKGEYNLVFRYLDNLTGVLPFEIYEKGWRDR